jgi:hypothetical protein
VRDEDRCFLFWFKKMNTMGMDIGQIIASLFVGVAASIIAAVIARRWLLNKSPRFALGVAAAFFIIGVVAALIVFLPVPTVEITSPIPGENIEVQIDGTGTGYFSVCGISKNVNYPLGIYILVHPVDRYAEGWFFNPSPAFINSDGSWYFEAQIGSSKYHPHVNDTLDILAIVTTPEQVQNSHWVPNSDDLNPKAKSDNIVRVSIG